MTVITSLDAVEILDSRSRPTLAVTIGLDDGTVARAGVPSGASTGTREAVELRDKDTARFAGAGVLNAVSHVRTEIAAALVGESLAGAPLEVIARLDQRMRDLDGTPTKARLGANAIVGASMALARALSLSNGVPLWQLLQPAGVPARLPVPHFNVVNGGVHAPNSLDFQEFMLAPLGAPSYVEGVRAGAEVYATLKQRLADKGHSTGLGDEGGFAPDITAPGHHHRRHRAGRRQCGVDQGQPDRDGVGDVGGDAGVPRGGLRADGVAPLG
jgi:enolase